MIRAEFSPDGRWLAAVTGTGHAYLWGLTAGQIAPRSLVLRGHEGEVPAAAFSPDSRWLATGGRDASVRLWSLASPTDPPVVLRGHTEAIESVRFSSDARWIVTGSADRTIRIWPLRPEELILLAGRTAGRNFKEGEWQEYFPGQTYRKIFPSLP